MSFVGNTDPLQVYCSIVSQILLASWSVYQALGPKFQSCEPSHLKGRQASELDNRGTGNGAKLFRQLERRRYQL